MDNLKDWLDSRYLKWQQENGRISIRKWSKVLGISYSLLNNMMAGNNTGTTMQTAYQIGERLNDFSILELLGYPVPDAPLTGFTSEQREYILDFLERVKVALDGLPPEEQDAKLKDMLDSEGWVDSVSD